MLTSSNVIRKVNWKPFAQISHELFRIVDVSQDEAGEVEEKEEVHYVCYGCQ